MSEDGEVQDSPLDGPKGASPLKASTDLAPAEQSPVLADSLGGGAHIPPDESRTAQFNSSGDFLGHEPRECGEHRTVGSHRAWCHDCGEWCYPDEPCVRCERPMLLQKIEGLEVEGHRLTRALEAIAEFIKEDEITTHRTLGTEHGYGACFACLIQATAQGALRGESPSWDSS